MKHYICTGGCAGVSGVPGTCQAIACPKYQKPLTECGCEDGKHTAALALQAQQSDGGKSKNESDPLKG